MTKELKPGMTAEELKEWRVRNWTPEELAQELMNQEERCQRLIEKTNELKRLVLSDANAMIARLKSEYR